MSDVYSFPSIEARAAEVVEAARRRAHAILEDARRQLAELRVQAQKQGHDEGLQQGLQKGSAAGAEKVRRETATLAAALQAVSGQMAQARAEFLQRAEHDAAVMALKIAERIVGAVALSDRDLVARTVSRAVELATGRHRIEVRLNPADRAAMEAHLPDLKSRFFDLKDIALIEDASVSPGGAVVRTESGEVDARLESQMDEIRSALFGGGADAGGR